MGIMGETAVELRNVWLQIPVQQRERRTLKQQLLQSITGGRLLTSNTGTVVEALCGISCTIAEGDRIALIGHNGAGKSTLLRLIAGIYAPSKGVIHRKVKVHPMIQKSFITEPDLSGLTAIKGHYLLRHGHLNGFADFLDDIVDFSGLGDFIHLPLKTYSEGMSARLLFAMLTHGRHECLAMDEGLGTGDAAFYAKAQERLNRFIANSGTLILASHSDELLRRFCTRGLVLAQGSLIYDASINDALRFYHDQLA